MPSMAIEVVKCPACGGKLPQPLPYICPYCRAALAVSVTAAPQGTPPPHSILSERFAAAERDPEVARLMIREVMGSAAYFQSGFTVVFGIVFVGIIVFMLGLFNSVDGLPGFVSVVPVIMLVIGVAVVVGAVMRLGSHASSPLLRRIGHIADERVEVSGGSNNGSARTSYYATLDFSDGSRSEYQVTRSLAGKLARGDLGLAYSKGGWLLDFERLKA
jgi:uncharacterized protein DUF2500